tara:strand:+ start:2228 stop:2848 length:621 start_codon:yes stop_codon:yes gene_type:complete
MTNNQPPIVLVHGLWDSHKSFNVLRKRLRGYNISVFAPDLHHSYGRVSLIDLADQLDLYIKANFKDNNLIDILGFSMGGLVVRYWLQKLGGASRTRRFISIGTPNKGTLLAHCVPPKLFKGISEMRWGSNFLIDLNYDISSLKSLDCICFYCSWDLMVIPGWKATLPVASNTPMPVLTHKSMILKNKALDLLEKAILSNSFSIQNV